MKILLTKRKCFCTFLINSISSTSILVALSFSISLSLSSFSASLTTNHIEILAVYTIQEINDQYFVKTTLDKRALTNWLKENAQCTPDLMISKCGVDYLKAHLTLTIDGTEINLKLEDSSIKQHHIEMLFTTPTLDISPKILELSSNYLLDQNDHGIIRVVVDLQDQKKSYTLKSNRTKMTYRFG